MATDPQHIEKAGDFILPQIVLHNHENKGLFGDNAGENITLLVQEFNLYESMFKGAMTGSLVIADAINLIGNLPIQGTERISFKLSTPGMPVIDCSEETGHPMHIYKLTNKEQATEGIQTYVLHFCSREFLRNLRTRVSKAYSGRIDTMVNSILGDENYLDTRKELFVQKTRNQDKIVIPNVKPFSAISMLCKRAMAEGSNSVGYYFYETPRGFHFRSWESLCVDKNGEPRPVKQVLRYMPMNINDPDVGEKVEHDFTSVEEYKFINNFHDVAANTALGTYGHRVITHNIYDKSYREDDYHYHSHFNDTHHTDGLMKRGGNPAIVDTPVDFGKQDNKKSISDYPESRVTVQCTTQYAHGDDTGHFGVDVEQDGKLEGQRESQLNQIIAGTQLRMTIKGQSFIQVGDVIAFDLVSVEPRTDSAGAVDPQFSGRYIITKIRHRVTPDEYLQVLECSKDSVFKRYNSRFKFFPGTKPKKENGRVRDINTMDNIQTIIPTHTGVPF